MQVFHEDLFYNWRGVEFAETALYLEPDLAFPVRLMPNIPKRAADKNVEPSGVRFEFSAVEYSRGDFLAFANTIRHVVRIRNGWTGGKISFAYVLEGFLVLQSLDA